MYKRFQALSPTQCRMARTALRIGIRELAELAGTSPTTVWKFENGTDIYVGIKRALRSVLSEAGNIFLAPEDDSGEGIRLQIG
jgi:transcriptional regulator with XRE-family HTH domain